MLSCYYGNRRSSTLTLTHTYTHTSLLRLQESPTTGLYVEVTASENVTSAATKCGSKKLFKTCEYTEYVVDYSVIIKLLFRLDLSEQC